MVEEHINELINRMANNLGYEFVMDDGNGVKFEDKSDKWVVFQDWDAVENFVKDFDEDYE